MTESSPIGSPHDRLIHRLAVELQPVRRLPPPTMRALAWLLFVVALALGLALFADVAAVWQRITAAPDMLLAVIGSIATAILAAIAAFQLSLPDRDRAWALLPLPGLLLWIGASGVGCLRSWFVPATHVAVLDEARDCLLFIVGLSVPLSILLIVMLRRACPLQPALTAAMAGLASASAAAILLNFFHPFDAAATDLLVHAIAVMLVILVNRALSVRTLAMTNSLADATGPLPRSN